MEELQDVWDGLSYVDRARLMRESRLPSRSSSSKVAYAYFEDLGMVVSTLRFEEIDGDIEEGLRKLEGKLRDLQVTAQ